MNPGSLAASQGGCACSPVLNVWGQGKHFHHNGRCFVVKSTCPLHGVSRWSTDCAAPERTGRANAEERGTAALAIVIAAAVLASVTAALSFGSAINLGIIIVAFRLTRSHLHL